MLGPAAPSNDILEQMKATLGSRRQAFYLREKIEENMGRGAFISHDTFDDAQVDGVDALISSFVQSKGTGDIYISAKPQSVRLIVEGANSAEDRKDVYVHVDGAVTFKSGWFGKIILQKGVDVVFQDCHVTRIDTVQPGGPVRLYVALLNTWVGKLTLASSSVLGLDVAGGGILDIDCVPPAEKNPFAGSVTFKRTFLPRKKGVYGMPGAQPYRNLRFHLNALQNAPAVSFVHSAEQGMEREDERLLNWLFSYLYELLSDYGASPARPIGWLIALWVCLTLTLFLFNGVEVGTRGMDPIGWQMSLIGEEWYNRLFRSAALSVQPLSWVGALSSQGRTVQLVAANIWFQGALIFEGILSAVLLTLFAFALRRRFRMAS